MTSSGCAGMFSKTPVECYTVPQTWRMRSTIFRRQGSQCQVTLSACIEPAVDVTCEFTEKYGTPGIMGYMPKLVVVVRAVTIGPLSEFWIKISHRHHFSTNPIPWSERISKALFTLQSTYLKVRRCSPSTVAQAHPPLEILFSEE